MADYQGHVAELLAKCTPQNALDQTVSKEDREMLLESLRRWGALDKDMQYVKGRISARQCAARCWTKAAASGPSRSMPSPITLHQVLSSRCGAAIGRGQNYKSQTPIFQPKGGMGQIGKAFGKELGNLIQYNCKVVDIHQDDKGVTATFVDSQKGGAPQKGLRRLVRLHHSRLDPVADPDERVGQDEDGDQPAALQRLDQGRPADEAPLLGTGRPHLSAA